MGARGLVRRSAQSQRDGRARRAKLRGRSGRANQIAASRAVGLSRQLGARAMKKATRPPRAPTREGQQEPNDGLALLHFPKKKASLDLALLGLIAEVPGVSGYDIM